MTSPDNRLQAFLTLHSDLPREAPGNRESTSRALDLAKSASPCSAVLDIGCGPGSQTIDLASLLPSAHITAVDTHQPYLDELRRRARDAGFTSRIEAKAADMGSLDFEPATFDLIWCEGAAYVLGIATALRSWRPLLAAASAIALTEVVWLRDDPPPQITEFWNTEYPDISNLTGVREVFSTAQYRLLGDFVLPASAWWDDYYGPLERRMERLARQHAGDADFEAVIAAHRVEIDMYRRFGDFYGYAFFVATPENA